MSTLAYRSITPALLCLLLLPGCLSTTAPGATGIQRKQFLLLPAAEVETLSADFYRGEVEKVRGEGALNPDSRQTRRVRAITRRLIEQSPVFRPEAGQWNWEVNVTRSDQLNAYCTAGGKIMVFSGLIDRLQLTDDELAAVLGHEIAHALREHTRERMSRAYAQQVGIDLVGSAAGLGETSKQVALQIGNLAVEMPHGRQQESEADLLGLELSARAGYDPQAAIRLWEKMGSVPGARPPEFLSTHPSSSTRIQGLRNAMPRVMPLYEAAARPRD